MINYDNGLFFENDTDLTKVEELLNEAGIKFKSESSYMAAIKSEIENQLRNEDSIISNNNITQVMDNMEYKIEIWNSLEEAVKQSISEMR